MKKHRKRLDIKYLTSDRTNLDDWNDDHILSWILETSKNGFAVRKFLVDNWIWRHRNFYTPIHLYGNRNIVDVKKIKEELDFWNCLFFERGLL
jgi:hypothetical protein